MLDELFVHAEYYVSPRHPDSWLLAIPTSYNRVADYNSFINLFWRLAQMQIFASYCKGLCGTSIAHFIRAMKACLSPN